MVCNNITPVSYANSRWVAGWLPILYQIRTNKWPVNTFDDVDSISSIVDNNGYAKVDIGSTAETYVEKEYVKISGSSVDSYDGVWQILELHSSTVFTLSAAYDGNDSAGSFQRYYNNYFVTAKIYTGIRSGHAKASDNPESQKGTVKVRPDSSNDAFIDVSSYVRADLSPVENDLCTAISSGNGWMGNDTNLWTSFYISYAESYDAVDTATDSIITFTSTYQDDMQTAYDLNRYYASNSVHQFQNPQGRSIGEYAIQDTVPDEVPAKWMTPFAKPVYFDGVEFDLAIINAYTDGTTIQYVLTQYDSDNAQLATETVNVDAENEGVYRFAFSEYPFNTATTKVELYLQKTDSTVLSETITVTIDRKDCRNEPIYLRWLNPQGGFDGWQFQANKDLGIDVSRREIVRRNIFNNWDDTFTGGDTQDDYYETEAYRTVTVRSQLLTKDQADEMRWLKMSNKVYEVFSSEDAGCTRHKKITVLVDRESFIYRRDADKFYTVTVSFRYTDQVILQGQ